MRKLTRGQRPDALDGLNKDGHSELVRAREHFRDRKKKNGFDFTAYRHKDVQRVLNAMTGGGCAYCEGRYSATSDMHVEHYRPKGRIDLPGKKKQPGYWWLAAAWENLLPSCGHCNTIHNHDIPDGKPIQSGKGDQFPVDDEKTRATAKEGSEAREVALLIDPTVDEPSDFLRFVDEGGRSIVKPVVEDQKQLVGRRARTSIDIYGLNRPNLVLDRSYCLQRVKQSLASIRLYGRAIDKLTGEDAAETERLLKSEIEILRAMVSGKTGFSAVARTLVEPEFVALGLRLD
jgi:uncharacterized protein (TIGR02646 family)